MFRNIVLFPHRLGQPLLGVNETPFFLRSFLEQSNKFHPVKCGKSSEQNLQNLYDSMCKIQEKKMIIGGDHSMSIATVAHTLNKDPKAKVLWIDAHADINTPSTSPSGNLHGMPLSFLTRLVTNSTLKKFPFVRNHLPFQNLMYIGLRQTDPYEEETINRLNIPKINVWDMEYHTKESLDKIEKFIGDRSVHVSFDVDVLDPNVMPCTGTQVAHGMTVNTAKNLFDMLKYKNIANMDITELNIGLGSKKEKMKSLNSLFYILDDYFI